MMSATVARAIGLICICLAACIIASAPAFAAAKTVRLPFLPNKTVSSRVIYIENPRFPQVTKAELATVVLTAADLVHEHFGITLRVPDTIKTVDSEKIFADLVTKTPKHFDRVMGDFKKDAVDWSKVKDMLIKQIQAAKGSLGDQIAFAKPYLVKQPTSNDIKAFAESVAGTFRTRLSYWTKAKLADGYPIIGKVPGREDLPLNEYLYWALMAKLGIEAEIVLTNQFIASVEYIPAPVHTAIRGGIIGGSSEFNPASRFGASVWMTLAPFLINDEQVRKLRNGKIYSKEDALKYAGVLLAHELGHLLLHLGHPWSNEACIMRPAEVLDFAGWEKKLNPQKCNIGSDPEMTPGSLRIPIW